MTIEIDLGEMNQSLCFLERCIDSKLGEPIIPAENPRTCHGLWEDMTPSKF